LISTFIVESVIEVFRPHSIASVTKFVSIKFVPVQEECRFLFLFDFVPSSQTIENVVPEKRFGPIRFSCMNGL